MHSSKTVGPRGSSPRGRGKQRRRLGHHARRRLIPAWAGKTTSPPGTSRPKAAHPHVGGENAPETSDKDVVTGSSPRGRGKRTGAIAPVPLVGLIPAWAGKTARCDGASSPNAAHPRVGGENQRQGNRIVRPRGSSPRGRGKRRCHRLPGRVRRLIPAWAGKTSRGRRVSLLAEAHPRVGGENVSSV